MSRSGDAYIDLMNKEAEQRGPDPYEYGSMAEYMEAERAAEIRAGGMELCPGCGHYCDESEWDGKCTTCETRHQEEEQLGRDLADAANAENDALLGTFSNDQDPAQDQGE